MIVLDTHAWIWWLTSPHKLGRRAALAIKTATRIGVSAISPWEVAMKSEAGKLRFDRPYPVWIEDALMLDPRVELLAITPRIAVAAVQLSWDHGDPADRLIVATARTCDASLVTADARIADARLVRSVWD